MSGTTEPWHLDKRVPIALILALVMQTAGMVWWAAGLTHRVDQHAREIAALALEGRSYSAEAGRIREVLARLDERMAAQTDLMRRLELTLSRRGE
jgi:hypothetical protein